MDVKILNGDICTDTCGIPVMISDDAQTLQRAFLRLKVPKGAFLHDADFGSRFFEINRSTRENADALAFLFAKQALSALSDKIGVKSAHVAENGDIKVLTVLQCGTEAEFTI